MSGRMRISARDEKLGELSSTRASFYMKYASFVLKTLRKPLFQGFLSWMLERENMEEQVVTSVSVMTFPFQKENGNALVGRCSSKGEIRIYPKRSEFCRRLKRKYGKERFYSYIKTRARATLIHELLHMRYSDDEERVRELTKKYFNIFSKHPNAPNPEKRVLKMLFRR
jgi:hypothetical protein